jgi:hypothetical protein
MDTLMLDFETHIARQESEWAKEREWCAVCDGEINRLAAQDEDDSVRLIPGLGDVCLRCGLNELESLEGSAA